MDSIFQQITEWLKEVIISAIMGNLSGMFESVNTQVGEIATSVGMTPANFSPEVFAMVRNVSESVIIPIAGLILTFIACYELIQMIIDHNNLANFETWIFFKWVFKTFMAVMLITNTFNITMAVFDVAQHVVNSSAGIIAGDTAIDATALEQLEETLNGMELGPLIGLLMQSFVIQFTMSALAIVIFVIVYGRMIEIYLMVSLAPIPFPHLETGSRAKSGRTIFARCLRLDFRAFSLLFAWVSTLYWYNPLHSRMILLLLFGVLWGIPFFYASRYSRQVDSQRACSAHTNGKEGFIWLRIFLFPVTLRE